MSAWIRFSPAAAVWALAITITPPAVAQVVQEHVTGLRAPARLLSLPDGQLLVAEAGHGPNTGRVSLVDRDGRRFTVVDGLPSGLHGPRRDPSGPSALVMDGRRLYVLIGNGDISIPGLGQGAEIPNPSPASPLFSSVLLFDFATGDAPSLGHALPPGAHATLASGGAVYLWNADGAAVRVSRLVDFPDYVAEPRPDEPRHVRISNPFGMVGNNSELTVVDASMNLVWAVDIRPTLSAPRVLARLAPVPNTIPGLGPPVVEAVPASIRVAGDDYVVSLLTGFPFGPGAASLWRIRRHTGEVERIVGGLQTAVDVWPLTGTGDDAFVLEYSQSFLTGGAGRLVRVDAARGTALPMAEGLRTPTGLARDTRTGDMFITEFSANRIVRVLLPR